MKLKIITGLSGSGKSTALNIFEDLGYYTMDNLPVYLIEKFIELNKAQEKPIEKLAVVVDFRSLEFKKPLERSLLDLKELNEDTEIIYLYSSTKVILNRYNELRRPHPLGEFGDVIDGLNKELEALKPIKKLADNVIDTSNYNTSDLRKVLIDVCRNKDNFVLNIFSFGYKNGISGDFDMIFDMRFIPNPFYIPELKKLNGTDQKLKEYLDQFKIIDDFEKKVIGLLKLLIPEYKKEGKNSLNLAFGCTGGKHRSVYMAERIYEKMKGENLIIVKKHRDKEKW